MYQSAFSRETEPIESLSFSLPFYLYFYHYLERDLLYFIGSHDQGGWEISWSAICKLETQESWWCSLKAWELESWWYRYQSGSEGLRTRSAEDRRLKSHLKQSGSEEVQPSFIFLVYSGLQRIGWWPATLCRVICISSPNQLLVFQETLLEIYPEIMFNQLSGHSLA